MPEVDRVLGNIEKMDASNYRVDDVPKIAVQDIMQVRETASHLIAVFESRVRAFLEIQNGCDHRCTFCSIPFSRGNNRSVPLGAITQQVRALVEQGCKEVVFTGVDITGYGSDLPGQPTLGQMLRRVLAQVPELPRFRLSSLDPAEVDEDVYRLMTEEPRLMPHLHISLQAGDDMILKRMKRRHLRDDVKRFCERMRLARPDAVFGCDIIAGFPTETDEMHQNSLRLIEECGITYLHVFPFSAREGTPAARMPQVPGALIKERANRLREQGKQALHAYLQSWVNKESAVLFENSSGGHSDHYAPVTLEIPSKEALRGQVRRVHFTGIEGQTLKGQLVEGV
jgi:threonylcarbamoyladenosine tRNA methylthiotransferase MtaB